MEIKTKLSPPWVTYVNQIKALFGQDPDIKIVYNNDEVKLTLYVENPEKADAIASLLYLEIPFGNVILKVDVIPANQPIEELNQGICYYRIVEEIFETAFKGNPVYRFSYTVKDILTNKITYIVFKKEVVQFFNDNLNDVYGNMTTLYQNIAEDILIKPKGIFFCTDAFDDEKINKPLGEWP